MRRGTTHRNMRTVVGGLAVLATVVAGCTEHRETPDNATPSGSVRDSATPEPVAGPRTDGPLTLADTQGKGCISLSYGRSFAWWEQEVDAAEEIELTSFSLVDANNVEVVGDGFISPVKSRIGATGFSLGWPPKKDVTRSRFVHWSERVTARGAVLAAGQRHQLWLHVRVDRKAKRASYRALEVQYRAGGVDYVARDQMRNEFRWRCA